MTVFSPHRLIYDESYHLQPVRAALAHGWKGAWQHSSSASGPLYAWIQVATFPLTHLHPLGIRLTNLIFLFLTLGAVNRLTPHFFLLLSLPPLWIFSGLGLTEMPALFLLALGLLLLKRALDSDSLQFRATSFFSMGAGVCFGFAFLGRQPFLMALPALAATFIRFHGPSRPNVLVTSLVALPFPIALILCWHGLVPPGQEFTDSGLKPAHLFFSFAYAGLFLALLFPRLLTGLAIPSAVGAGMGLIASFIIQANCPIPLESISTRLLPSMIQSFAPHLILAFFSGFVAFFCLYLFQPAKSIWENPFLFFCWTLLLLLCVTPLSVSHQFSSRYTGLAAPLLLLLAPNREPEFSLNWISRAAGALIGSLSLVSYYYLSP